MISRLKRLFYGLAVVFLAFLTACSEPTLEVLGQGRHALSAWQGKWLFINYWAEWCTPCRKEIPELNRLHQYDDIEVLAVNFDRLEGRALTESIRKMNIQYPSLVDDPSVELGVKTPTALPMTIVVSPDGEVNAILYGPQHSDELRQRFLPES